jgi:DNA modification methylase
MAAALLYAEARLGELIRAIRPIIKSSGPGTIERKLWLPEGVSRKDSHYARQLSENLEAIEKIIETARSRNDIPTRTAVLREIRERRCDRKETARYDDGVGLPEYLLVHADMNTLKPEDLPPFDAIITDLPYGRQYLPLYEKLAMFAAEGLPEGGSCLVMVGQSYLPEIFRLMSPHINYQWEIAYLLSGKSYNVWSRKIQCHWKPVIWFVKGTYQGTYGEYHVNAGPYVPDIVDSDSPEKQFHEHGQSVSGMTHLIEHFSSPGQTVLDPFCGGGTIGVAALVNGRNFIGVDIDKTAIEITRKRIDGLVRHH